MKIKLFIEKLLIFLFILTFILIFSCKKDSNSPKGQGIQGNNNSIVPNPFSWINQDDSCYINTTVNGKTVDYSYKYIAVILPTPILPVQYGVNYSLVTIQTTITPDTSQLLINICISTLDTITYSSVTNNTSLIGSYNLLKPLPFSNGNIPSTDYENSKDGFSLISNGRDGCKGIITITQNNGKYIQGYFNFILVDDITIGGNPQTVNGTFVLKIKY